jgi:hypothetical protein
MGLLKVREMEIQREHSGAQVESAGGECPFLFQVLLKPMGRTYPGDSHPVMMSGEGEGWFPAR